MFINLHVLFTMAGANPNRDDTGAPKTLFYGGVERSRISSQAMTRAKRIEYEYSPEGEKSYRSVNLAKDITNKVFALLAEKNIELNEDQQKKVTKDVTKKVSNLTSNKEVKDSEKPKKEGEEQTENDRGPKDTLIWLAENEVNAAAELIADSYINNIEDSKENFITPNKTASLSIAAFGRMFANRPDLQNEAAVQRSDAFTTHRAEIELDFFTAVDDLATTQGAGHLGMKMETGGVYYWHANIDVKQLLETWVRPEDPAEAQQKLTELLLALFMALPTGGQNTHAHHVLPSMVLVTSASRPISLQSAFETPVTADRNNGGFLLGSVEKLSQEHVSAVSYASWLFSGPARYSSIKDELSVNEAERVSDIRDLAKHYAQAILESN
jgi:CRISPR system Cascade subunit CasC